MVSWELKAVFEIVPQDGAFPVSQMEHDISPTSEAAQDEQVVA